MNLMGGAIHGQGKTYGHCRISIFFFRPHVAGLHPTGGKNVTNSSFVMFMLSVVRISPDFHATGSFFHYDL